jgi:hypothetical protein
LVYGLDFNKIPHNPTHNPIHKLIINIGLCGFFFNSHFLHPHGKFLACHQGPQHEEPKDRTGQTTLWCHPDVFPCTGGYMANQWWLSMDWLPIHGGYHHIMDIKLPKKKIEIVKKQSYSYP